jgi:predicted GNAT family N-acyltransferase
MEPKFDFTQLKLILAESDADRFRVYDSRVQNYTGDCDYLLNNQSSIHPGKDEFDDRSFLFLLEYNNKVAATCRCTPAQQGEWEISSLVNQLPFMPDEHDFVQFNRVLVDRKFRSQRLHELMFYRCSLWMLANTSYRSYFSVCKQLLLRFYLLYGAQLVSDKPVNLSGRGDSNYFFVHGEIEKSALLLENHLQQKTVFPIK